MEFHAENSNAFQQNQKVGPPVREWSEEFQCYTVNGILAPSPLSHLRVQMEEDEPECSLRGSSKKKRTIEGTEKFFLKLFKFPKTQSEEYLLEMHKVETSEVERSHLILRESNGEWKIGVYDPIPGDHVVFPVVEDPSPPKFPPKYLLPLQERLIGWTVERRKRSNGKEDEFYYHGGRQFRSFVEVTAFILYSTKLKDLKVITPTEEEVGTFSASIVKYEVAPIVNNIAQNYAQNCTYMFQ